MNILPKARTENIVVQDLKNETLVYDLITNKAFNLNQTLSIVFNACNGVATFAELKRKYKFTDDLIYLALDELKREDLLADAPYQSPFANIKRREVIKKVGLATMAVLPLIAGLVAPKAAHAASNAAVSNYYSRDYLESCTNTGPFCFRANGFDCINDICCVVGATGSLLAGSTFDTGLFIYPAVNGSCEDIEICNNPACSSSQAVQSDCSTTPIYGGDDENEITSCLTSCTCTCQ